jgi:hypothetical protein
MSIRSLNGLAGNTTNNIYVNTLNNFTGVLPLEVSQGSTTDPVNISIKGLNGFTANKILKVNSAGTALEYADDSGSNWTLNSGNLYPNNFSTTTVSINTTGAESGYVFKVQGHQYNNGNIRLNGDLETRNGTNGIDYNTGNIQKIVSGSVNATYSFPSSTGTLALTSEIPTIPTNVIANGKTGLTSYTQGDILYYNSGTTLSKLPIGTAGQILKVSSGGIIEWGTVKAVQTGL